MTGNVLSAIRRKILDSNPSFLIGSHRVDAHERRDYTVIINGLSLWVTLLLDQCSRYLPKQDELAARGRIMNIQLPTVNDEDRSINLSALLEFMDNCNDVLLQAATVEYPFKGDTVRKYIQSEVSAGLAWPRAVLLLLFSALEKAAKRGECSKTDMLRELHQTFCFLKKLQVTRPDLERDLMRSYIEFEDHLRENVVPSLRNDAAQRDILAMNVLARSVLADFAVPVIAPRHGPGAVSSPDVKSWFDKNLAMASDARIGYLLRSRGLGQQTDYCPWVRDNPSTRTSRFVGVPKTWKKLRGIAAEPVELQFYQQGVFHALDEFFRQSQWWSRRVDLHRQDISAELARLGSIHDGYATIDLSSASDSVTLELVKQVFKGTSVLPWLLGTRSCKCQVGDEIIHLSKFASMGSACCFPVECMIFTLAAQVASDRTRGFSSKRDEKIRVFGDDIIVEWYAASELIEILQRLGFSTNVEKSYLSGYFREACGAECYYGVDIRPIRYSSYEALPTDRSLRMEDYSVSVALINATELRGYHLLSRSLLELLLASTIAMKGRMVPTRSVLPFSFSGSRGTVATSFPTNFNVSCRWNRALQVREYRRVTWKMRPSSCVSGTPMGDTFTHMQYVEWLIDHQVGLHDWDKAWEKGYLDRDSVSGWVKTRSGTDISDYGRLPLGMTMVPTCSWAQRESADILWQPSSSS